MAVQMRQPVVASETVVAHAPSVDAPAAQRFQTPDQLFGLLDGRTVMAAGQLWKVEVFGIRDLSGQRWIQLALVAGGTRQMATLRLAAGGTIERATAALAEWITNPVADIDGVLNVA